MLSKTLVLVALALTATVSGMATPGHHAVRSHQGIAARKVSVVDVPQLKKRDNSSRCKPRPSSTSSTSTTKATTTASPVGNVAADPTTTEAPPPPPPPSSTHSSSTEHSSSKTTSSKASSNTQSSGGGGGNVNYGFATYYYVADGNEVACGGYYQNSDPLVAISINLFQSMGGNSICGKTITASYNGNTITVPILDECESCNEDPYGHIDLSPGAIQQLDPNYQNDGQINIQWHFN
jgi:hypothetical protein